MADFIISVVMNAKIFPVSDGSSPEGTVDAISPKIVSPTDTTSSTHLPRVPSTSSSINRIISDPVFKKLSVDFRRYLSDSKSTGNEAKRMQTRRKSMTLSVDAIAAMTTGENTVTISKPLEDASDSESVVFDLLNQVSSTISELKLLDTGSWAELTTLTNSIMHRIVEKNIEPELQRLIYEHSYSLEGGWNQENVDIDQLMNSLATLYMTEKTKDNNIDSGLKVKNIQSLSFCPNTLFGNFPAEFTSKPCSTSFNAAVLLADISGFSKFAGQACLRGPKGLDMLHRVTSEFLGLFVKTVYDFEGDGKYSW